MPDIQEVVDVSAIYISYATGITVIFAVARAGLSLIWKAITGRDV